MIFSAIIILLCFVMLMTALLAIVHKNLLVSVIAAGGVSLTASIIYLVLAAPDVAMTEASIGSGLSTIIFLYVMNRVRRVKNG